jgi:adenylate cyclase, class 2
MSRNIEWKGQLADWATAHLVAARVATRGPEQQKQRDTYFPTASGRLKLREIHTTASTNAELIWYQRSNQEQTKASDYELLKILEPERWQRTLSQALGVLIVVEKERTIYWHQNVRIHLDRVTNLGDYLEFEAVLDSSSDESAAHQLVQHLIHEFSLDPQHGIAVSYSDLLLQQTQPKLSDPTR